LVAGSAVLVMTLSGVATAFAQDIHGHRGARGLLPENTMPAFEKAVALGVDILELDTGVTSDGVVVVNHDRRLSPDLARKDGAWITAPVAIRSLTWAELQTYDVGRARPEGKVPQRFPDQVPVDGTPIPMLAEVLALGQQVPGLEFNIETKISPLAPEETVDPETFAAAVVAEIRKAGLEDRAIVQSFDWRTLVAVKTLAPKVRTAHLTAQQRWLDNLEVGRDGASPWLAGIDVDDHGGSAPRAIAAMGGDIWSPFHRDLTDEALAEAHELGLEVHVWTPNKSDDFRSLKARGVDGIITDYPDIAVDVLR
jgi:glycerophosphoryl diester phosphodiesterase